MAATKKIILSMCLEVTDAEAIKRVGHHVDELIDLDSWPEIVSVCDVQITEESERMTQERAVQIASDYINLDASAADPGYILTALDGIGVTREEAKELDLDWLYEAAEEGDDE